jgi:hypothetical protein
MHLHGTPVPLNPRLPVPTTAKDLDLIAPGSRVVVRDLEWQVVDKETQALGTKAIVRCVGRSELVRDRPASFFSDVDEVKPEDPKRTTFNLDTKHGESQLSSGWRDAVRGPVRPDAADRRTSKIASPLRWTTDSSRRPAVGDDWLDSRNAASIYVAGDFTATSVYTDGVFISAAQRNVRLALPNKHLQQRRFLRREGDNSGRVAGAGQLTI